MKEYNTTQLYLEDSFNKQIFHRDWFAHYLRFIHVLKIAKINMKILDLGCGNGQLLEALYRNRYKPSKYHGLDIRAIQINNNIERYKNLEYTSFQEADLCNPNLTILKESWDIITCFETIEHIQKKNIDILLLHIKNQANSNTRILISTPCYSNQVGAAGNHTINGEPQEFTFEEMKAKLLSHGFIIDDVWGTFASQKDYINLLEASEMNLFNKLKLYYDSNIMSILFAPLFPQASRNCLWSCRYINSLIDNR